ncbi:UNVERIFIED_CONTAM: hypothetical protein JM85_2392 [Acetobacter peroxydans]
MAARRLTLGGRVARPLGPSYGFVDSHSLEPEPVPAGLFCLMPNWLRFLDGGISA